MDEEADEDDKSTAGGAGGVLRGALRSVFRRATNFVVTAGFGSLPRPRVLAKHAEKIADFIDAAKTVVPTAERLKLEDSAKSSEKEKRRASSSLRHLGFSIFYSLPTIAKSSVAGGCLFSSYDYVHSKLADSDGVANANTMTVVFPFLAGLSGGAVHAAVSISWDLAQRQLVPLVPQLAIPRPSIAGTLCAHSLMHACLFATYHGLRDAILSLPQQQGEIDYATFVGVTAAGGLAGMLVEVATHYLSPLETKGVVRGLRAAARLSRPVPSAVLFSFVPSAIGFLAFEFG